MYFVKNLLPLVHFGLVINIVLLTKARSTMKYLIVFFLFLVSNVIAQTNFVSYGKASDLSSYADVPSQSSFRSV